MKRPWRFGCDDRIVEAVVWLLLCDSILRMRFGRHNSLDADLSDGGSLAL